MSKLTVPQTRTLYAIKAILADGETPTEGWINEVVDVYRSQRRVLNNLRERGLVEFGTWWDEDSGYDISLTSAGWEAVAAVRPKAAS